MKKIIFFSSLCLMAFALNAQEYVDLGLPSGTLWKSINEIGFFSNYSSAFLDYGNNLPTKEQFKELADNCEWTWRNNGYKVTGPNGQSIFLPAEGFRDCNGELDQSGQNGSYWSSSIASLDRACALTFTSTNRWVGDLEKCSGHSVRLVKNK